AIQPAQLAVALSTLDQLEARARQIDRQWQLRLERAQYEADLAHRRYNAVEPDNRLVARSLERDWNAKLTEVEQLQREHAALPKPTALLITPQERERILALAQMSLRCGMHRRQAKQSANSCCAISSRM